MQPKYFFLLTILSFFLIFPAFPQQNNEQEITTSLKQEELIIDHTILLNNEQDIVPLRNLRERTVASIRFGMKESLAFNQRLMRYAPVKAFDPPKERQDLNKLADELKFYNTLIFQVDDQALKNADFLHFMASEAIGKQVILCGYGAIENLALLDTLQLPLIWTTYTNTLAAQTLASAVFGGVALQARLSKNISARYTVGSGFTTIKSRLGYAYPEALGISSTFLADSIGAIVDEAIAKKATPGAVVMVVKNGEVIFERGYGYHTYDKQRPTLVSDLFDMASVSKITATTPSVMRLAEEQKIDLNQTIGHYLVQAQHTNKANIKLRDVMLHQAGFIPFIPFFRHLAPTDMSRDSSAAYAVKLADGRFLRTNYYEDVMWPEMLQSKVNPAGQKYVYSDISMYVMKEVVEQQASEPIERYVQEQFYQPLGMYKTGYRPRDRFPKEVIVPTENDTYFRNTLLEGFVHDPGAAMANGVAGHAGIFSTANDLAIYAQMLLNKGTYGGEIYFQPQTVEEYTSKQSSISRRGLGFDRWDPDLTKEYPSKLASPATFGHTGYTGTCIWIDPEHQLTYIFLSNRVHPTDTNTLLKLNIRSRIQDVIYKAIAEGR